MSAAKKLPLIQGSKEWLEARYDFLTASQAPVLFDLSRFETPLGLFEEKIMCQEMRLNEGKEILFARGHNAEARAREWLKEKGFIYEPAVMVNDRFPDLLASLDGLSPDGTRILECKFVGEEALLSVRSGVIPPEHLCQIQAALMVSEAKVCDYFATAPSGESHWLEIAHMPEYQVEIALAAKRFMQNVREGKPPEPGARDFFTPEKDERFDLLTSLKAQLDEIEDTYEALKKDLIEAYKDKPRVQYGRVQIIRTIRKGTIDYAKVPVLKGVDLDKYRKPSSEVVTVKVRGDK